MCGRGGGSSKRHRRHRRHVVVVVNNSGRSSSCRNGGPRIGSGSGRRGVVVGMPALLVVAVVVAGW